MKILKGQFCFFDDSQKLNRLDHLQRSESLPEFFAVAGKTVHQIEQIFIAADDIFGFTGSSKIDDYFVFRVALKSESFRHGTN